MTTTALQARALTLSMTVNDLKRSLRLYTDGLGFVIEDEFKDGQEVRGAMLAAGEAKLGISQDDFAKGRDRIKGLGMRVYIETEQDLEALARQARAAGLTLEGDPAPLPWGPLGFSLTDPDGYRLTIANPG